MHILVSTPMGKFHTVTVEQTDEEFQDTIAQMRRINELSYMKLETTEGLVFMAKGLLQQSLFVLVRD